MGDEIVDPKEVDDYANPPPEVNASFNLEELDPRSALDFEVLAITDKWKFLSLATDGALGQIKGLIKLNENGRRTATTFYWSNTLEVAQ